MIIFDKIAGGGALLAGKANALVGWSEALGRRVTLEGARWNERLTWRREGAVEKLAMVVLVLAGMAFLAVFGKVMVTTPLQVDEVGTVRSFSSKGPGYVMTHYGAAKNHVFFNLLSSVTPGRDSYAGWRGRLWSLLAFAGLLGVGLRFFVKRKWYLEGGFFFFFATTSQRALETNLAARGYGLLAFFSVLACVCVWSYFERPRWGAAIGLAVCVVLGTYSVPHYLLFGGLLLLLLWWWTRDGRVWWLGVASVLAIGLLYAPILGQVASVATNYSDVMGQSYPDLNALYNTFNWYLLQQKSWVVFAALVGVAAAPFALWKKDEVGGKALTLIGVTSFVFLVICLKMETPRVRATNFVTFPLLFIGVLAVGKALRMPHFSAARCWLVLGAALFLAWGTWIKVRDFKYIPKENFQASGEIIRAIYPKGVNIHVNERPDKLANSLPKEYLKPGPFDEVAWARGAQAFLDSDFRAEKRPVPSAAGDRAIELRVPQSKGKYQAVWVVPWENERLSWKLVAPDEVEIRFATNAPVWSINIFTKGAKKVEWTFKNDVTLSRNLKIFSGPKGTLSSITRVGKPPPILRLKFSPQIEITEVWALDLEGAR